MTFEELEREGTRLALEARDMAKDCANASFDALAKMAAAQDYLNLARAKLAAIPAFDPNSSRTAEQQVLDRQASQRRIDYAEGEVAATQQYLALCGDDTFPYDPTGGTFEGSTVIDNEKCNLVFTVRAECNEPCLVQVLHHRKEITGTLVDPLSQAQILTYTGPDAGVSPGQPPADADAAGGHVVDTDPRALCPCLPGQVIAGGGITGVDTPGNAKANYDMYFEVAAVCTDGDEFRILGTMRWRRANTVDGLRIVVEILRRNGNVDWGRPTPQFAAALTKWLGKRPIEPDTVRCVPPY